MNLHLFVWTDLDLQINSGGVNFSSGGFHRKPVVYQLAYVCDINLRLYVIEGNNGNVQLHI